MPSPHPSQPTRARDALGSAETGESPRGQSRIGRRSVLAAAGGIALAGFAASPASAAATTTATTAGRSRALSIRGADLSFLPQLEEAGVRYRDLAGRVRTAERIIAGAGATHQRIRVWVDPPEGYTDKARALALARRAKRAGLKIVLDPHFSDFWADPGKQPIPAGWPTDLPALTEKVRTYTRDLVREFAAQGTPVDIFQMGNEITAGILWPVGKLYPDDGTQRWSEFTTLLKAGITGAHQGAGRAGLKVMLHIDRGGKLDDTRWFFDNITEWDVPFDIIGQSYYAMWHGSLAQLKENLEDSVSRYGKPVLLAEISYPWTFEDGDGRGNIVTADSELPDIDRFPATPAGQAGLFEAVRDILTGIPGGNGLGFLAWEPEWVPGVGWEPGAEAPNDNLTQFDFTGRALPSIKAYRRP
ncbi:glycosyl hydrolase 53 family protein [Kineosporia sp. J2-2]|uniref:Arabinogalactan endo-beta-1,4-galactanase n=1 Tax=Kineosporia corallincola TaxID=2835133 RepID=A0ABS5TS94_9ACTN|nr:glycosyl hydrolase 53 family protein [Kineosporia corallincola]MBT0773670.1 glycosyl hydrolase 53 family protein [Kineosporia corallincola]